jgi:hypothetical protein
MNCISEANMVPKYAAWTNVLPRRGWRNMNVSYRSMGNVVHVPEISDRAFLADVATAGAYEFIFV